MIQQHDPKKLINIYPIFRFFWIFVFGWKNHRPGVAALSLLVPLTQMGLVDLQEKKTVVVVSTLLLYFVVVKISFLVVLSFLTKLVMSKCHDTILWCQHVTTIYLLFFPFKTTHQKKKYETWIGWTNWTFLAPKLILCNGFVHRNSELFFAALTEAVIGSATALSKCYCFWAKQFWSGWFNGWVLVFGCFWHWLPWFSDAFWVHFDASIDDWSDVGAGWELKTLRN